MKLGELVFSVTVDTSDFASGMNQVSSMGKAAQGGMTAISAKAVALGHALYDAGKQAAKMAVDLGKAVINEYADTEQLLGGVETIFKDHAQTVIDNASKAFRTAGMSANDYMQNVTGFSSSLLQGLNGDTAAAASVADMAIQDMSDNANKFGTNIGMIQNAYQGFARDNFTMLDNLKLGYGGTQEEMARLINDSGVLGKEIQVTAETVKDVPLDKIFLAIHKIQEEMDITGTTAKEATSTISGSASAFSASWENVLSGLANKDADIGILLNDLYETGSTYVGNILSLLPVIAENAGEAFSLIMEAGSNALSDLYKAFQKSWDEQFPDIVKDGANSIISTINSVLGTNIPAIESVELPTWAEIEAAASTWWEGIRGNLETLARWAIGIFETPEATADEMQAAFGAWWEGTAKPAIEGATSWALSLFEAPDGGESEITAIVSNWWATAGQYVENACTWALSLFNVPDETADDVIALVSTWWAGISTAVSDACKVVFSLAEGDTEAAKTAIGTWWGNVRATVSGLLQIGFDIVEPLVSDVQERLSTWWDSVLKGLGFVVEVGANVHTSSAGAEHGGAGRSFGDLPGHETGLSWVPHDDYVARLHVGEAVLTRKEADEWRNGSGVSTSRIEGLLASILSALDNPVPAVIDGPSVYDYVSRSMVRDVSRRK